jgi:hypothetical protein
MGALPTESGRGFLGKFVDVVQLQETDRIGDAGPEKTFYQQGQDKEQMVAIVIV